MSEKERHENRAEGLQDEAGSTEDSDRETPDVEAHRLEVPRLEEGLENEDRHRNEAV